MLTLLQPLMLTALAGILLPLLIHLWNRREGQRVKVGSIRWLEASRTERLSRIRFSGWLRFFLRTLIISLLAVLLAKPVWENKIPSKISKWILLENNTGQLPEVSGILDSFRQGGYEMRALDNGFPILTQIQSEPGEPVDYWSLLREIAFLQNPPDSVVILARPLIKNFNGQRPRIPLPVRWVSLPTQNTNCFVAAAWEKNKNILILLSHSNETATWFEKIDIEPENVKGNTFASCSDTILIIRETDGSPFVRFGDQRVKIQESWKRDVLIFNDPEYEEDRLHLEAALRAIGRYLDLEIHVQRFAPDSVGPENADLLFWLSGQELPKRIDRFEGKVILINPGFFFRRNYFSIRGGRYLLNKRLRDDPFFPQELMTLLMGDLKVNAGPGDQRQIDERQIFSAYVPEEKPAGMKSVSGTRSLQFPLWVFLVFLFVLERLTAKKSNLER